MARHSGPRAGWPGEAGLPGAGWDRNWPGIGVYAAIAAYCRAGNNAIVDAVFYDPEVLKLARDNFAGLGVFSVGLHCELAEAIRRETSRGDRAAALHALVRLYVRYDLSLDATCMPAAQAAQRIASAYLKRQTGTAFWAN